MEAGEEESPCSPTAEVRLQGKACTIIFSSKTLSLEIVCDCTADDNATIRVTNLSEDTRETDLQELFRPFGSISRIYLAKDKNTGQSKVRGHFKKSSTDQL